MTQLVIVGAGGFGRETLDVIEAINADGGRPLINVIGVIDDSPGAVALERLAARGVDWLGGIDEWLAKELDAQYLVCIGDPRVRSTVDQRFRQLGFVAASVVHPRATIGSLGAIGPGAIVCSGAEVSTNVILGRHVHVNPNATIGHDSVLSDYVSINPAAVVSGEVFVGSRSLIGAGAVILQGLSIGAGSTVGASACVTTDVGEGKTVKGIPAR